MHYASHKVKAACRNFNIRHIWLSLIATGVLKIALQSKKKKGENKIKKKKLKDLNLIL